MLRRKKWIPIAIILLILEVLAGAFGIYSVISMNMLPDIIIYIGAAVFLILFAIIAVLLFGGTGRGPSVARRVRRIFAIILVILTVAFAGIVGFLARQVTVSVETLTETKPEYKTIMGLYTLSDSTAEKAADLKGGKIAVLVPNDSANLEIVLPSVETDLGDRADTEEFKSIASAAKALYEKKADAILVNEAFLALLNLTEDYTDFDEKTKLIAEYGIEASAKEETSDNAVVPEEASSEGNANKTTAAAETSKEKSHSFDITKDSFIVYISGSDTRSRLLEQSNSDVNILMGVNPRTHKILLLNTPRDYYIPNPAGGGAMDKLTHDGVYGIQNSMQALSDLYDVEVRYYLQINFAGFEALIDALGGVTVNSPNAFSAGGYTYYEGDNYLDGAAALAFARERYSFAAGDRERGNNQMRVIQAVFNKVSSSGASLITNFSDIMASLEGMFATDVSAVELTSLAKMQLNDPRGWSVENIAVSGSDGNEYNYSLQDFPVYVMYPDYDQVNEASQQMKSMLEED